MKNNLIIDDFNQLRELSDPLRAEMMMHLVMRAYTGQQLSYIFSVPRGKIHYHLKELEKNGLVQIVKTEEKNGIVQKFYQAVAADFQISEKLLPRKKEIRDTTKQLMYGILERAKQEIREAPAESFETREPNEKPLERRFISSTWELEATEEQFKQWKIKYYALLKELHHMGLQSKGKKNKYYITTVGFQTVEKE